ncbi:hypothetical protein K1T71_004417 [Dendrolimus kikuchii]|uniref:Uncharacterized protein n=1 Tax=Dendrolimus kikuchii TaxID=765133 RepID=A0ACC1D7M2_9NEOP|nr:hypothetical protein K1T71_004417 [Dendrolimus kikuchii]
MNDKNNLCTNSTPPQAKRRIRNPFDKALIDRLHKPICSPGMCKIYKKKSNGSFRWDIDQACALTPADIVACNSQFEPSPDPALEQFAEEATERFFSQEMIMPSPLETSKKIQPLLLTSCDTSVQIQSLVNKSVETKAVSAQTVLTLPPNLPPEVEKVLAPFCTYFQDHEISDEYEITANGSLRRKLFFEEHSEIDHDESEHTDDEILGEIRPPSSYESHTRVEFSPDLSQDLVAKGMKRTFGTPLKKTSIVNNKPCYRNKILDVVDFGEPCFSPIEFRTPKRKDTGSATSSSLASVSISPVTKATSSDEEKNNFTSPESDSMATCLDCISQPEIDKKESCLCKITPNKIIRSASLKESQAKSKRSDVSFSERRSLSLSSLNRSRSVQKLDFSMDMSIEGYGHDQQTDSESPPPNQASWSLVEEVSIQQLVQINAEKENITDIKSTTINVLDETPIKGFPKSKNNIRTHEISKIRIPVALSPLNMSLDNSMELESSDNPLCLEDKKIDFNNVDLKFLTDNISQFNYTMNEAPKVANENTYSFKRVDSGFNDNTFYASSYYESAIKPSELTVTNISQGTSKNPLKEISNVHWMRVDSGFKDENSTDSQMFANDNSGHKFTSLNFTEVKLDKENVNTEQTTFDRFLVRSSNKNETMSMSDIFTNDMTFHCLSSTPSKNKSSKILS